MKRLNWNTEKSQSLKESRGICEDEGELFLKTIIPRRRATEKYLGEKHENKTV
jgi:hypothetical protein